MRFLHRASALATMAALVGCGAQVDGLGLGCLAGAPEEPSSYALTAVNVTLLGKAEIKWPRLRKILGQLERTYADPSLWGATWTAKVPISGTFTNYTMAEIVGDIAPKLSDGTYTLIFRPQEPGDSMISGSTKEADRTGLGSAAGNIINHNSVYTDYRLARTIFHEQMHTFQYRHWTAIGRFMDYEGFPTAQEPKLPTKHFDQTEFFDPHGAGPVPANLMGEFNSDKAPDKTCTVSINLVKGSQRGRVDMVDHEGNAGKGFYVEPDVVEIDFAGRGKLRGTITGLGEAIAWSDGDRWERAACKPPPKAPTGGGGGTPSGTENERPCACPGPW